MDLKTNKWETIPSMNYPRCTTMTFVHDEKIYVAGGFFTTGKRISSIEIYSPKDEIWYLCGNYLINFLLRSSTRNPIRSSSDS